MDGFGAGEGIWGSGGEWLLEAAVVEAAVVEAVERGGEEGLGCWDVEVGVEAVNMSGGGRRCRCWEANAAG